MRTPSSTCVPSSVFGCSYGMIYNSTFHLRVVVSSHECSNFCEIIGTPPNVPIPPGVIPNSVSQQLAKSRITESSMSSMLRIQQEHARSLERMATLQSQIIELQQIQTLQVHFMQQMMLPLAFQCNAFMSSMSSLVPGVRKLFTQPFTFVQSALGSSGTLCDPLHGLPGSSSGPLEQFCCSTNWPGTLNAYFKWSGTQTSSF